jgi:hypothetical protein
VAKYNRCNKHKIALVEKSETKTERRTIHNIPNGLQSRSTNWPLIDIKRECFAVKPEEENIRANVEDGINTCCEEGKGYGRYCCVH